VAERLQHQGFNFRYPDLAAPSPLHHPSTPLEHGSGHQQLIAGVKQRSQSF